MNKNPFFIFLLAAALAAGGCSQQYVTAQLYLYRAGQAFYKTDNQLRRIKKLSFDERKKYYDGACQLYYKALLRDRRVFNLDEIEHALQCCESAEQHEITTAFQNFYAAYQVAHPVESDYGLVPSGGVQES